MFTLPFRFLFFFMKAFSDDFSGSAPSSSCSDAEGNWDPQPPIILQYKNPWKYGNGMGPAYGKGGPTIVFLRNP